MHPVSSRGCRGATGAWWSLTDWCVDDGYTLAACYDAAAVAMIAMTDLDPRGVTLGGELDRPSVRTGLEEGYALTQIALDLTPSRLPLEELTPGRPRRRTSGARCCAPTCPSN